MKPQKKYASSSILLWSTSRLSVSYTSSIILVPCARSDAHQRFLLSTQRLEHAVLHTNLSEHRTLHDAVSKPFRIGRKEARKSRSEAAKTRTSFSVPPMSLPRPMNSFLAELRIVGMFEFGPSE